LTLLAQSLARLAGWVALLLGLWLALALWRYHPADPGWSHLSSVANPIRNWAGPWGAWWADGLLFWFGVLAWVWPALLVGAAWMWLRGPDPEPISGWRALGLFAGRPGGWRLAALPVGLAAACLHADLRLRVSAEGLPFAGGGALGRALHESLQPWAPASTLILFSALIALLALGVVTAAAPLRWLEWLGWWAAPGWGRAADQAAPEALEPELGPVPADRGSRIQLIELPPLPVRPGVAANEPRLTPAPVVAATAVGAPPALTPQGTSLAEASSGVPSDALPSARSSARADPEADPAPAPAHAKVRPTPVSGPIPDPDSAPPPQPPVVPTPPPPPPARPAAARVTAEPETPRPHAPVVASQPSLPLLPPTLVEHGRPALGLLDPPRPRPPAADAATLEHLSRLIEERLSEFGVRAAVVGAFPGPVITRFELAPAAGVKVSQISNLAKDLARALSVVRVRVVEVIPGKPTVGLEIPNPQREVIALSELVAAEVFQRAESPLTIALGKDIGGAPVIANLARMPHLLVAGTTGSGKSVGVNAMLLSMLYKAGPEQLRLILIDPKMLELSVYEGIPHLLCPVVTDMKEAAYALRWAVAEMERRYRLMAALGVRNLAGYNQKLAQAAESGAPIPDPLYDPQQAYDPSAPPPAAEPLPYVVVVVDEFADLFMVVGKKIEELIARIAQKARAAGIHLVLATQRPSVDVITGLIKANIPTRLAFQVSSKVDSRTILDQMGAENLLGQGDSLYLPPGTGMPVRVHGAFVSDDEVHRVVEAWKTIAPADYIDGILEEPGDPAAYLPGERPTAGEGGDERDALYDQAVAIVLESRKASISYVQRRLKIGYNRAARMIEMMEGDGVVGPVQANGNRSVLAPPPPSLER